MSSLEILARMGAKTCRLDGAGGSRDALRPEDVALALAGLSNKVFLFGLWTIVNDQQVQPEVVYHAHLEVVDLAIAKGWRAPPGSEIWRKMAILALCEVVGVDCGACGKRGFVGEDEGVPKVCTACDGGGRHKVTTDERVGALGVGGRDWLGRYELAYRRISGWQTTLEDHLRRRLRPHEPGRQGWPVAVAV
jgi:hypothetical protein